MRIAYINSFYAPNEVGGAEKSVRFLAEAMVKMGHEACVITLGNRRETAELNGVRIERLPIANLYHPLDSAPKASWKKLAWHSVDSFNLLGARAVGDVLDHWEPDVAHTNNVAGFSVAVWQQLKARHIPIVHTLRDYYLLCPNTAMFKHGKPCERQCGECRLLATPRGMLTKLVHTVIGNSHFILNKHKAAGLFSNAEKSGVIYNAYAPDADAQRPEATGALKLGYIGRLAATKGVETFIDAVALAANNGAKIEALIAGEGDREYVDTLRTRANGLPIRFLGRVKPENFYSQIDWTVVPSLWDEPLARVIFESFCHGVPVIGTTTGGTPELVIDHSTGRLFPPGSHSKLAEIICEVENRSDAATFKSACLSGSGLFAPQYVCDQYLKTYLDARSPAKAST